MYYRRPPFRHVLAERREVLKPWLFLRLLTFSGEGQKRINAFQDRCNRPLCHPSQDGTRYLAFRSAGAFLSAPVAFPLNLAAPHQDRK